VLTIAAARATYLAFFRRRDDEYDPMERMRPGMLVAFGALAAGCVAFGVLPGLVLSVSPYRPRRCWAGRTRTRLLRP
jgi:multicomponent Na+:H+ antiporter subunit D